MQPASGKRERVVPLRPSYVWRYIVLSNPGGNMAARTGFWLVSIVTCIGCGSGIPPAADTQSEAPSAVSSGGDAVASPAAADSGADIKPGLARVVLRALVNGKPVAGHVRVLDAGGKAQEEGPTGSELQLRAGSYSAEVSIDDAAALADRPTQVREIFLTPNKLTEIDADFPWSKIVLDVLVQGHSRSGVTVKLLRKDAPVATLKSGAQAVLISPGKYEADVMLPGNTIRVTGLMFPDNGAQTVPVRVH